MSLSFNFRIGQSTVCSILKETCEAIWTVLQPQYVRAPSCSEEWIGVSKQFEQLWNFPNCISLLVHIVHEMSEITYYLIIIGAVDGKHIAIQAPINAGSEFYNYKNYHSVVLMAVCDAHYRSVLCRHGVSSLVVCI